MTNVCKITPMASFIFLDPEIFSLNSQLNSYKSVKKDNCVILGPIYIQNNLLNRLSGGLFYLLETVFVLFGINKSIQEMCTIFVHIFTVWPVPPPPFIKTI